MSSTSEPLETAVDETPDRELSQFLSYRIVRAHHALNAQAVALLDNVAGITLAQWRVMVMVGSGTATTARDIARKSIIDPAMISRTVHGLEEAGMLLTSRPESDRRVLQIEITPEGQKIYDRTLPHMQARQQALLDALDPVERDLIYGILEKLEVAAEQRVFED